MIRTGRRGAVALAAGVALFVASCVSPSTTGSGARTATDPGSGATTVSAACPASHTPASDDRLVYVLGTQDRSSGSAAIELTALTLPTGVRRWAVALPADRFIDPRSVSLSPCAPIGYVQARYAAGHTSALIPFNTVDGRLGTPIPIGIGGPVAVAPDGLTAYVANQSFNVAGPFGTTLTPVDLRTDHTLAPIPVGGMPGGVAVTSDSRTIYVSVGTGLVPIDARRRTTGTPIPLPPAATGQTVGGAVAIDPIAGVALVGNLQLDLGQPANLLNVVNLAKGQAEDPIPLGGPYGSTDQIESAGDSGLVVVGNITAGVEVVDPSTRAIVRTFGNDGSPWTIGAAGTTLYLVDDHLSTSQLLPIAIANGAQGHLLPIYPNAVASLAVGP